MPDLSVAHRPPSRESRRRRHHHRTRRARFAARHDLSPTATAAVGRLTTGAALFGAGLKGANGISLQIAGDGPIGSVARRCVAARHRRARRPRLRAQSARRSAARIERGKFDVAGAVGTGSLQVDEIVRSRPALRWRRAARFGRNRRRSRRLSRRIGTDSERRRARRARRTRTASRGRRRARAGAAGRRRSAPSRRSRHARSRCRRSPSSSRTAPTRTRCCTRSPAICELRSHRTIDVRFRLPLHARKSRGRAARAWAPTELRRMADGRAETEATCEFCKKRYVFTSDELSGARRSVLR